MLLSGFIVNSSNVVKLFLISESLWVLLYASYTLYSSFSDDIVLLTNIFFIIALAGLEFSVGFVLVMGLDFFLNLNSVKNTKKKINSFFKDLYSTYTKRYVISF